MIPITLDTLTYSIEFHHIRSAGRRRKLNPKHSPVAALTLATIVASDAASGKLAYIASDVAICSLDDKFSRYDGRTKALAKLLTYNRALAKVAQALAMKYTELTGDIIDLQPTPAA